MGQTVNNFGSISQVAAQMSGHLDITQANGSEPLSGKMSSSKSRQHYDPYDEASNQTYDDVSSAARKKITLAPSKRQKSIDSSNGNPVKPKIKLKSNTEYKGQGAELNSKTLGSTMGSASKIGPIKAGKIVLKRSDIKMKEDSESGKFD